MADYLGDFAAGATVRLWWNTNAIAGESITRATDGSIRVYKNSSDTERNTSAGITDTEDADTLTGVHRLVIDLSDNTDAGFYAAGNDYSVVLVSATIDGKVINHALGQFSIENRFALTATALRDALGLASANLDTQLSTIDGNVDDILADTAVIGTAGAGLTAVPWNTAWDSEVQSEVADALTAYAPPTKAELDAGLDGLNDLSASDVRVALGMTTANLDAQLADLPTNGELTTALSAADDAVLAVLGTPANGSIAADIAAVEAQTDDIGTFGAGLTALPWNAAWDAHVESEVADALNAYDPPTNAEMEARTLVAASYATAAALATVDSVADAIQVTTDKLDDTLELDSTVYRFTTNALEQAPAGGGGGSDPLTNSVPGSYEAGTAGYVLGQIPAIKAKTDQLTADTVTLTAPLNPVTGDLVIVSGDSYTAAASRAIEWSNNDWTPLNLSAATSIMFRAKPRSGAVVIEVEAEALSDTQVQLELDADASDELASIGRDAYAYELVATLTDGSTVTLAAGKITTRRYVP